MVEPVTIEVERDAVRITWDDGLVADLPAAVLRAACPCAGCREPGARERLLASEAAQSTVTDARLVGGYAVGLTFGPDGHATGIFPFPLLRGLGEPE